jgi:hypothetical protein
MARILGRFKPWNGLALLPFAAGLIIQSCARNHEKSILGNEFAESQTRVALIDTFSVSLSTVILDTLNASGTGRMLVGNYRDGTFGKLSSSGYFQIGIPDNIDAVDPENDRYDSLRLAIRYNGYSIGDTTLIMKMNVYRLAESIVSEDGNIDRTASFRYDPDPVGSLTLMPGPNGASDTLFVKISDEIGLDWFAKIRDGSEFLTDNETFESVFHGLVLSADETSEGSIIGFMASSADVNAVLYTSRSASLTTETVAYEFPLQNTSKQFNRITHDFSSTPLQSLTGQKDALPDSETDGLAFCQGGIPLAVRVSLPSFPDILMLDRGVILKAQLTVAPLRNSYDDFDLPSTLTIAESDGNNRLGDAVATSALTVDDLYKEETVYVFTITDYIKNELSDSYLDPAGGFLITLPADAQASTLNRLVVDAANKNTRLIIYYLYY